jgi:hypothetical protein
MNHIPIFLEFELLYRQNELLREAEAMRLSAQARELPDRLTRPQSNVARRGRRFGSVFAGLTARLLGRRLARS